MHFSGTPSEEGKLETASGKAKDDVVNRLMRIVKVCFLKVL